MKKANLDIRDAAKRSGVKFWQVAAVYGVNDGNFSRKLRKELPPQERERILAIIADIARSRTEVA